jgi:alanine racemase
MDHLMVDVGDHPVAVGDVVQLFGDAPGADELAAYAHTISYEVLCGVGLRVPRIYVR